jgi:hypothetical protein
MSTLSDREFLKLNNSGQTVEQLPSKTIVHNGVELEYYEQPPGKMIELMLAIGEAMKTSTAIEAVIETYLPQLHAKFTHLAPLTAVEIVMLVLQQQIPGGLPIQDSVAIAND